LPDRRAPRAVFRASLVGVGRGETPAARQRRLIVT
jgi:hypothetical protein